jgi:hypothetical protein
MRSWTHATAIWSRRRWMSRTCRRSPMARETRLAGATQAAPPTRNAPRRSFRRRHPAPSLCRHGHRVPAIGQVHPIDHGRRIGAQFGHRRLALAHCVIELSGLRSGAMLPAFGRQLIALDRVSPGLISARFKKIGAIAQKGYWASRNARLFACITRLPCVR